MTFLIFCLTLFLSRLVRSRKSQPLLSGRGHIYHSPKLFSRNLTISVSISGLQTSTVDCWEWFSKLPGNTSKRTSRFSCMSQSWCHRHSCSLSRMSLCQAEQILTICKWNISPVQIFPGIQTNVRLLPCQMRWPEIAPCSCCKQILTWTLDISYLTGLSLLATHHSSKDTAPSPFSSMAANWSLPGWYDSHFGDNYEQLLPDPFQNSKPNFWGKAAAALIIPNVFLSKCFSSKMSQPSNSPSSTLPSKSLSAEMKALKTEIFLSRSLLNKI